MATKETVKSGGVGLFNLLGLLFLGLKLTGYINWTWWLVLLPFYGPLALVLIFCFVLLVFAGIAKSL